MTGDVKKFNEGLYKSKAKDSFKTKWRLYLFSKLIAEGSPHDINVKNFNDYTIDQVIIDKYTFDYHNGYKCDGLGYKEIGNRIEKWSINEENVKIINEIEKGYVDNFGKVFSKDDFCSLLLQTECAYCHISFKLLDQLFNGRKIRKKSHRGENFEIERLDSNREYTKGNCKMACHWCNNAKTDEFTYEEFLEIGKVIESIWRKRLES